MRSKPLNPVLRFHLCIRKWCSSVVVCYKLHRCSFSADMHGLTYLTGADKRSGSSFGRPMGEVRGGPSGSVLQLVAGWSPLSLPLQKRDFLVLRATTILSCCCHHHRATSRHCDHNTDGRRRIKSDVARGYKCWSQAGFVSWLVLTEEAWT
jgi:hypothetical protein